MEAALAKIDEEEGEFKRTVERMTEDGSGDTAWWEGAREGLLRARRLLVEALAAEEAPLASTSPRQVNVPADWAVAHGITYGCAAAVAVVREIPAAGPGMWRVVGLWMVDPGVTTLWVVPA